MNQDERRAKNSIIIQTEFKTQEARLLFEEIWSKFIKQQNGKVSKPEDIVRGYYEFVMKVDGEINE